MVALPTLLPLDGSALGVLIMLPPAQSLVVVEDGGAYGLFGSVLAYNVLVDTGLEVARVELRDAVARFMEDGPSAARAVIKLAGLVGARETGVEVGRSPDGSGGCRSCEGTSSGASEERQGSRRSGLRMWCGQGSSRPQGDSRNHDGGDGMLADSHADKYIS